MVTTVLSANDVIISPQANREAEDILDRVKDSARLGFLLDVGDGDAIPLPLELSQLFESVIQTAAKRGRVTFSAQPTELTSSAAAIILGISRPTLMKLVNEGKIPAHRSGTHTRIRVEDLSQFISARNARRLSASEQLLKLTTDLI